MNKKILGSIVIFIIIISAWNSICFADVVFKPMEFAIFDINLAVIIGVLFIVAFISYFILKAADNNGEAEDKNEKKKKILKMICYILGFIFLWIIIEIISILEILDREVLYAIIILLLVTAIVRIFKQKKLSKILLIITIALICILSGFSIINKNLTDSYNLKIYELLSHRSLDSRNVIENIEGLINDLIENNKSFKKTSIIYKDHEYVSSDELKELLSIIDTNKTYTFETTYDSSGYLKSISVTESRR